MSHVTPAVVLRSKFILPESAEYKSYIDYIDREDAKVKVDYSHDHDEVEFKLFHRYMDYMGDDEKDGELFTSNDDNLSEEELKNLKEGFSVAQRNGSPMWQDVISFDNEWLEEQGLYDSKKHELNEARLRDVVRKSVSELLKQEGIPEDLMLWTGAVHYNTENIHVHLAMVQPEPTLEMKEYKTENGEYVHQFRGKRKQKSLDRMKSRVVNEIYDRTKDYKKIDELIRNPVKKKRSINLGAYEKTKRLFAEAIPLLPEDVRQWQYAYHSVDDARPLIDEIGKIYLEEFHPEEMNELYEKLDEQVDISKRLFGEGSNYDKYKDNKLDDLRKRMGNAVLSEMREFHKANKKDSKYIHYKNNFYNKKQPIKRKQARYYASSPYFFRNHNYQLQSAIMRLNRVMRKSFHEYQKDKNVAEFDRMLEGYDY